MSASQDFRQSAQTTLTVRFSDISDAPKLNEFYNSNQHQHVDGLTKDKILNRAKNGRVIIIEDQNGNIGAASMGKDHIRGGGKTPEWTEIGATRSVLSGLGIYPFIIASQVIHETINTPPQKHFIACIYKDNQAVTDFLNKKVGWHLDTPSDEQLVITGEKDNEGDLNFLESTADCLPHQASIVLDFMNRVETEGLKNKKTGETVRFDFSRFSLANEFRQAAEALARGPFADDLKQNRQLDLKTVHDKLHDHMKNKGLAIKPV